MLEEGRGGNFWPSEASEKKDKSYLGKHVLLGEVASFKLEMRRVERNELSVENVVDLKRERSQDGVLN